MTYDVGFLSCAKGSGLFSLFKQFVATEMIKRPSIIVRECIFKIRTYVLRRVKG